MTRTTRNFRDPQGAPRGERAITDRLRALIKIPANSPIVLGPGDDCAIYRPRGSADDLLFTTDLFIEGVHFLRQTHNAADVARKAVARGLSDIAAMGGAPRFCLVSLCVPRWANEKWVDRFFDALMARAAVAGAVLAGGDLSRGETFACDVTVCGAVPRGTALRRDGARAGHEIYVSGVLGGSALGLQTRRGKAWRRHLNPEPRLALGTFLREKLRATAAIDLSDGLSLDLQRLCIASGVAAEISTPPRFRAPLSNRLSMAARNMSFCLPFARARAYRLCFRTYRSRALVPSSKVRPEKCGTKANRSKRWASITSGQNEHSRSRSHNRSYGRVPPFQGDVRRR